MQNYFVLKTDRQAEIFPIIGAVSYSTSDSLETSQRYGYDYSKAPQSLVYRRKNTALEAAIQLSLTPALIYGEGAKPMDYIASLEGLCGKKATLFWNGQEAGSFVVKAVNFSCTADLYQIFSEMQVSLQLTEGYVRVRNLAETKVMAQ